MRYQGQPVNNIAISTNGLVSFKASCAVTTWTSSASGFLSCGAQVAAAWSDLWTAVYVRVVSDVGKGDPTSAVLVTWVGDPGRTYRVMVHMQMLWWGDGTLQFAWQTLAQQYLQDNPILVGVAPWAPSSEATTPPVQPPWVDDGDTSNSLEYPTSPWFRITAVYQAAGWQGRYLRVAPPLWAGDTWTLTAGWLCGAMPGTGEP